MFKNFMKIFKKNNERLHLVLMQDRANVSADFLDLMRQEIIEVIKKYIDVDEKAMDVRLTNQENEDGTQGAPVLYANIPIVNIKDESKQIKKEVHKKEAITKRDDNTKKEKNDEIKQKEENKKIEEAKKIVEVEEENKIEEKIAKTEEKQIEEDTEQKEIAN